VLVGQLGCCSCLCRLPDWLNVQSLSIVPDDRAEGFSCDSFVGVDDEDGSEFTWARSIDARSF
jgi:hypothetical protein